MTRVLLPAELPPELAEMVFTRDGRPLNLFRLIALHPALAKRLMRLGGFLLRSADTPVRAKELVILRVAQRAVCAYEFNQHALIGREAGLTDAEVEALAAGSEPSAWPADDAALLAMADELHDATDISEETWSALAARWRPDQLLELVMIAGFYRTMAGVMKGFRLDLDSNVPHVPIRGD